MKFSKVDYRLLSKIEAQARELAKFYSYPEVRELAVAAMKVMKEATIEETPKPTWKDKDSDAT